MMHTTSCRLLALLLLFSAPFLISLAGEKRIYVSPNGNDAWSGARPTPSVHGEGPLATVERALERAQALAQEASSTDRIRVLLAPGRYPVANGLVIQGDGAERITLAAASRAQASLTGNVAIDRWEPVRAPEIVSRIAPTARAHLVVADLRAQGVHSFGELTPRGGPPMELFFKGKRMQPARWPNDGWERIADVPQSGDSLFNEGLARERRFNDVPVGRHFGRIRYAGHRPSQWAADTNIVLHGYWTWDWSDSYQRVAAIDTARCEITLARPHHHYGYTTNQRYAFLNVLEELDRPGEWYVDRGAGLLYFWPPVPLRAGDAAVSRLDTPLLTISGGRDVAVEGIVFEQSRGPGVVVHGGRNVRIAGCTFRALGGDAVVIDGGTSHQVRSCDIHDVAMGGIRLTGGDRLTLAPAAHAAINNHVHHYSTWLRTGQYALWIAGVGNRLANNLVHDAPFEAIYVLGNDHCIEYNDVHDVLKESGDAGALHTGRDWTWRGTVIRYNYFHHLQGPGLHGVMGVYLDDWASGFTVLGNLFYRAGRATLIGGGRDNIVRNNIYLECTPSIHLDARGLGWAGYYFTDPDGDLVRKMRAVHGDRPPYTTRYPELATLYQDDPAVPKGNRIERNVSAGGRWMDIYDYLAIDRKIFTIRDNLIADPVLLRRRADGGQGWDPYYLDIDRREGYVAAPAGNADVLREFPANTYRSPGTAATILLRGGRPMLPTDSPAYKLGFERIPVDRIGLIRDRYRPALP